MKVLIITNYPFPYGMAQTNRLIAMAKGLLHAGLKIKIIVTKATETPDKIVNKNRSGNYEGIDFEYATPETVRPHVTIRRSIYYFNGFFRTFRIIAMENRKEKVDALFLGVTFNLNSLLFYFHAKWLRIRFLQERSEYPFLSYSKSFTGRIKLNFYLRIVCKLFDGLVVISNSLESYFKPYVKKNATIFLLPILVETERFNFPEINIKPRITYCGSMQGDKDGVPILIESFGKIANKFPDINLYLIGSIEFGGFSELQNKIEQLRLGNRVIFTGRIEREQMPELLSSSKILALARPYTKQAEGGFPTKLGEYLATGRITIVTAVGDIPDYLSHKVNALLAIPGDTTDFASNIEFALENEEEATKIGKSGKNTANEIFNYKVQGAKLAEWLKIVCHYD